MLLLLFIKKKTFWKVMYSGYMLTQKEGDDKKTMISIVFRLN